MKILELIITNLDKVFSFPVLVFVILLIFRKPLYGLLDRIQEIRIGNDIFNAEAQLADLKNLNAIVSPAPSSDTQQTKLIEIVSFQHQIELLADISPAAAIPFAFSQIVNKCSRSNEDLNNWKYDQNFINDIMQDLYERKEIDKNVFTMFTNMKSIYQNVLFNKEIHPKINRQFAIEYGKCAETLMDLISTLEGK